MLFRGLKKRGVVTQPGVTLVGTLLALAAIVLTFFIVGKFTGLFFSEKNEEFAVNNFIALANKIETLSKSTKQFDVQRAFPFYFPHNYVVIGFNKKWGNTKISDGCEPEPVRKPSSIDGKEGKKCENSACVCLFENKDDLTVGNDGQEYRVGLVQCHSIEADYVIALYLGTSRKDKNVGKGYGYPKEIYMNLAGEEIDLSDYSSIDFDDYAFFYLYGQCGDFYWDQNLQSRKLYIEKFTDNNDISYIFIAPEGSAIIDKRYEDMNVKYGKIAKSDYIDIIEKALEKEASGKLLYEGRVETINAFVKLINYYGVVEEIKPHLMRVAVLYLRHPDDFRKKLDPIIQALDVFKSSAEEKEKIKAQFFISRLSYEKKTVNDLRKAILEMQKLVENNKEDYSKIKGKEYFGSPCVIYDQKIREKKREKLEDLFLCAYHLLNLGYDVEHILIYASEDEEFKIDDYKIKVIKVKSAEEATISIHKFDEDQGMYELVECNGKQELTIHPKNSDIEADEYNENISYEYSLKNLLNKCIKET